MSPFHSRTIRVTSLRGPVGDWLAALGVDRRTVVAPQDISVSRTAVTLIVFTLDSKGKRRYHTAVVPLTVDPSDYGI